MPVNYLNIYVFAIFGGLAATVGGIFICYTGMSETSYLVYRGMELTTYYLDKNRHDLYLNGLVYSITFGIAFLLLLAVIVIPSPEQIQKRLAATSFAGSPESTEISVPEGETPDAEDTSPLDGESIEIELEPDIESYEVDEEEVEKSALTGGIDDEDSDVVYGTGRITDEAHKSFIISSPDSAIKFLMRKELDGRPLKSSEDEIYEDWQERGLSRGKLRKHILKIMEWENVPELEVNEIYNQVKDKAYEISHS
ncbi:MAG: hypothetical protein VYA75_02000 [SAR324 cluster bacterium]|nr:hypothetical protein [SAR324 cluster bacterium]